MGEEEFDQFADQFRDPRVWWIQGGEWWKDNIWGSPSAFGPVYLDRKQSEKYLLGDNITKRTAMGNVN